MNSKSWAILNLVGFAGSIVANALANALPLNGFTTGQLSDMYPNLFVPAGFTFGIWGIIYLWLAVMLIYGLVSAFSSDPAKGAWVEKMGPWFFLQSLFNASWIFAWHYLYIELSLLIMLGLLGTLVLLHRNLQIGEARVGNALKFVVHAPISVYLGWITIATVANVTTLLVNYGFSGGGIPEWVWAAIVLVVATGVTLLMQQRKGDFFHSAVALWALYGIYEKRSGDMDPITELLAVLGILAVIILGSIAVQWSRKGLYRAKIV